MHTLRVGGAALLYAGGVEGRPALHFPAPHSLFVAYLKLALLGGLILALPLIGLYTLQIRRPVWTRRGLWLVAGATVVGLGLLGSIVGQRILGNAYLQGAERGGFGYLALQSVGVWTLRR